MYQSDETGTHRDELTIFSSQAKAIDALLADLVAKLPARFALLTEGSGQVVSFQGSRNRGDGGAIDLPGLGVLAAGDLAASREIARIAGEYQDCQLILREGRSGHILIAEAGRSLVLLVQVHSNVPLGWARMLVLDTSRRLAEIVAAPTENPPGLDLGLDPANLSDTLQSALDSILTGESDVR